jgi:hypothetical protein
MSLLGQSVPESDGYRFKLPVAGISYLLKNISQKGTCMVLKVVLVFSVGC